MGRSREDIAIDLLSYLMTTHEDEDVVLYKRFIELTFNDLVYMCSEHITTCPDCGAEFPVNIDCVTCTVVSRINKEYETTKHE